MANLKARTNKSGKKQTTGNLEYFKKQSSYFCGRKKLNVYLLEDEDDNDRRINK